MKADLHMHSTASDGEYAPDALMARVADAGITLAALTDHDNLSGIEAARRAAKTLGVAFFPGVELGCGADKEIHILGYGVDPQNEALLRFCDDRRSEREERAHKMVEQLAQNGMPISLARVRELARGVIARPHVARTLVEAGFASSVSDAFDRYLLPGKCGYVPKRDVKVAQAVELIHGAGGVAVLAHPMKLKYGDAMLSSVVREWASQGLDGIEVYHPSAQNNHVPTLLRLAHELGLMITGGSDFHGEHVNPDRKLFGGLERWTTVDDDARRLLERIGGTLQR